MSNLDKQVLVLNRSWQPINVMTVQKALSMMAADAATAFDFCEDGYFIRIRRAKIKKRIAIFASEDLRHDTLDRDVLPNVLRGFCIGNQKEKLLAKTSNEWPTSRLL